MYLKFEVGFFNLYDKQTLSSLCKVIKVKKFDKNEIIFKHATYSDIMYVIVEG